MTQASVAVLMTCYNRRDKTLDCLRGLERQGIALSVFLVDDGSTDGTSEAVRAEFFSAKIFRGDGNLFWAGGMRLAFAKALEEKHDFYIWLNDDTVLFDNALTSLIQTYDQLAKQNERCLIVVGSVQDPVTKQQTYGGRIKNKRFLFHKFGFCKPGAVPKKCDTFQGNIVLIPNIVAERVGNIDPAFVHNFGDLDYGLRATKMGCSIWVAPHYLGECSQNSAQNSWVDLNLSVAQRIRKALHAKSFPIKSWTVYVRRHNGLLWFLRWPLPYIRAIVGYRNLNNSPTFSEGNH